MTPAIFAGMPRFVPETSEALATVHEITKIPRRRRAINLAGMDDTVRQLLANCRDPACTNCKDGIDEARGQRLIICQCAFVAYNTAAEFMKEEQRRRKAGLPMRQGKLEAGKIIFREEPQELPPGQVTL